MPWVKEHGLQRSQQQPPSPPPIVHPHPADRTRERISCQKTAEQFLGGRDVAVSQENVADHVRVVRVLCRHGLHQTLERRGLDGFLALLVSG